VVELIGTFYDTLEVLRQDFKAIMTVEYSRLRQTLTLGICFTDCCFRMFSKGYILLEEQATDSFQNLLFSILLFRKATGRYPKQIRIITHAFKAKRFLELHAPAIRWPKDRIQVQGIDPIMSVTDLESTLHGEEENGYAAWKNDPMGTGDLLGGKRKLRGWDANETAELYDDLEESVRELVQGNVSDVLPWMR
jgi:hypothetical protein